MNRILMNMRINSGRKMARRALVLGAFLVLPALLAFAAHSVFVTVPFHSEEALTWCGPATGQMVIGGYPASACTRDQADVAASILAHKVESNWDTDPAGLRDAMMEQCPPPGGHWAVFSTVNSSQLMYSVAYWMTHNHYPVAVLLGTSAHNSFLPHQEHWIVVKGIITDVDPTTNPTVNLQYVNFVDPSPLNFGDPPIEVFASAFQWSGLLTAVTKSPSAYQGKFVAVIEPPPTEGHAVIPGRPVATGRVIPGSEAVRFAREAVETLKLAGMPSFREFAQARPLEPLLVNAERGGYYLVPFSVDQRTTTLAVLVNAYNGQFLEAGHFAARALLSEGAAVERVRGALKIQRPLTRADYMAALVSSPDTSERYFPEWSIKTRGRTLMVPQHGTVHEVQVQTNPQ